MNVLVDFVSKCLCFEYMLQNIKTAIVHVINL